MASMPLAGHAYARRSTPHLFPLPPPPPEARTTNQWPNLLRRAPRSLDVLIVKPKLRTIYRERREREREREIEGGRREVGER